MATILFIYDDIVHIFSNKYIMEYLGYLYVYVFYIYLYFILFFAYPVLYMFVNCEFHNSGFSFM